MWPWAGKSTDLSETVFPHMKKEEPGDFQDPFPFCASVDEDQETVSRHHTDKFLQKGSLVAVDSSSLHLLEGNYSSKTSL